MKGLRGQRKKEIFKTCTYCGIPAYGRDHVVPYCYTTRDPRSRDKLSSKGRRGTVPCCTQCNSFLSSFLIVTVADRAHFLLNHRKVRATYLEARLEHLELVADTEWLYE